MEQRVFVQMMQLASKLPPAEAVNLVLPTNLMITWRANTGNGVCCYLVWLLPDIDSGLEPCSYPFIPALKKAITFD
jgi:hypothetical protein